mmetsp:Transcript_27638/g.110700  ORF Transcript_27638/g.110700 Transcript_27638/m.110700 type:complete len:313 (-) Transcript_27638:46-984(-)
MSPTLITSSHRGLGPAQTRGVVFLLLARLRLLTPTTMLTPALQQGGLRRLRCFEGGETRRAHGRRATDGGQPAAHERPRRQRGDRRAHRERAVAHLLVRLDHVERERDGPVRDAGRRAGDDDGGRVGVVRRRGQRFPDGEVRRVAGAAAQHRREEPDRHGGRRDARAERLRAALERLQIRRRGRDERARRGARDDRRRRCATTRATTKLVPRRAEAVVGAEEERGLDELDAERGAEAAEQRRERDPRGVDVRIHLDAQLERVERVPHDAAREPRDRAAQVRREPRQLRRPSRPRLDDARRLDAGLVLERRHG